MTIEVTESGRLRFHGDLPFDIGIARIIERCRVSRIVPANPLKQLAFTALRLLFGDRGSVAAWTRNWTGPWQVRWISKPGIVSFQHAQRKECLRYERRQLELN